MLNEEVVISFIFGRYCVQSSAWKHMIVTGFSRLFLVSPSKQPDKYSSLTATISVEALSNLLFSTLYNIRCDALVLI